MRPRWPALIALLAMCALSAGPAWARAADIGANAREKALFSELRCVVCQNQSIAESDADVARDLRAIVREQISEGRTDGEIKQYLTARYGEFVLLRPVFAWHTLVLWAAPLAALLVGALAAFAAMRRRTPVVATGLTQDEEAELERLRTP